MGTQGAQGLKRRAIQRSEGWGVWGPTYTQKEAPVLFDGAQAAEEARHHDDGAYGNDEVGCRQRWEAGGEGGEIALGHGEPNAHSKQSTATELEREGGLLARHCPGTRLHKTQRTARPSTAPTSPGPNRETRTGCSGWCDLHKAPSLSASNGMAPASRSSEGHVNEDKLNKAQGKHVTSTEGPSCMCVATGVPLSRGGPGGPEGGGEGPHGHGSK